MNMQQLVEVVRGAGFRDVSTYINSGNLFFTDHRAAKQIRPQLETLVKTEFGLTLKILLRDKPNIDQLAAALPETWQNNEKTKCDILFLDDKYDSPQVLNQLDIQPNIDEVHYVQGALLWKIMRHRIAKSGQMKLPKTDVYAHMTVRNCNTLRKLAERLA